MSQIIRHMGFYGTNRMCKVCVLGANGGIGRHLALKLKLNNYVTDISLYDVMDTTGVCADISHIDTKSRIKAYSGNEKELIKALHCSNIVVIVAGQAHSPEFRSREAMFSANAELMVKFMKAISYGCECIMPFIHIITNPVNALVPVCAESLKEYGCYNPRRLIGSASIDAVRAKTFLGQLMNKDPAKLMIPVIGGHSAGSITPLLSQRKPHFDMTLEEQKQLAQRIIYGAFEVIDAKNTHGASQLSIAHCAAGFCNSVCRAIYGEPNVVEVGYVPSDLNELDFFSCYFTMDHQGIKECLRLPPMKEHEVKRYYDAVKDVQSNIDKGRAFVRKYMRENREELLNEKENFKFK